MASALFTGRFPYLARVGSLPPATPRGRFYNVGLVMLEYLRLPTDDIGTFALTLTNVVVGSAIQIEDQAGTTTFYNGTAATSSPLINLSAYAPGASLNDLRIKVRKGSSGTTYKPFETLTTASVGAQSIYVSQIQDE